MSSPNPTITQLDAAQAFKRAFDEPNDSIRVEFASGVSSTISLTASTDSVSSQGVSTSKKASIDNTSTGVIVPAFSCVGLKEFNLYTNTTSTITDAQVCTLEISPSDNDNVWIASSLTITPSTTNAVVVMGTTVSTIVARRARVSIATNITSGTFDLYALAQA